MKCVINLLNVIVNANNDTNVKIVKNKNEKWLMESQV